jgi:hypothetical protein
VRRAQPGSGTARPRRPTVAVSSSS